MQNLLKSMKKISAVFLSLIMVFNIIVIGYAQEEATGEILAKMSWTDDLDTAWKTVDDGAVFDISDFEPGDEAVRYIKIENQGAVAYSYELMLASETELGELASLVDVYFLSNITKNTQTSQMGNIIGTLAEVINGTALLEGKIDTNTYGTVAAIGLKMHEGVDSTYMGKAAGEFSIKLIAESADKFFTKFKNTDEYLYRVGNANDVALGSLFGVKDYANIGNVSATVTSLDASTNVRWNISKNASDWTKSTIKFSGTGPVAVTISDDKYANPLTLNLEIVDAKNVTSYSNLTSVNSVLLNDITMSSESAFYLSNATLYGNGFTFDVTNGAYKSSGYATGNYLVSLTNAALDNVKIVGAVYTQYGATSKDDYNRATVYSTGNNTITNCYISNCASPVRVNDGSLEIINSTLKGGNFANLDIRGGNVVLDNIATINQVNSNDIAIDGTVVAGLGIVVYHDNVLDTTTVEIKNGITQYNYLSKSQANDYIKDTTAKSLTNEMFASKYSNIQYSNGSDTWVNSGIISMTNMVGDANISDVDGYSDVYPELIGVTGYVHTKKPDATSIEIVAPEYLSAGQGAIAPAYRFDYTTKNFVAKTDGSNDYCYEDNGTVLISMDDGDTFNWDTSILTATKSGQTLDYTVTMNGTDYTGKSIPFNSSGDYTVVYTYTDNNNYNIDENGNISTYSKVYTKNVHINVSAVKPDAKNAEFKFGSSLTAAKTVTIGNDTYVMPDVSSTSSEFGSITVSGTPVYYTIVDAYTSDGETEHSSLNSWYMCYPVFKNVVSITDYASAGTGAPVTYDSSTTSMPSGLSLSAYSQYYAASTAPSGNVGFTSGGADAAFKYQATPSASADPKTLSNVLIYASPTLSNNARAELYLLVQYSYKDNAGATYCYYVGYHMPETTVKTVSIPDTCVTPDTLITLADGTQKRVDEVTSEDVLKVWDFEKGEYTSVPSAVVRNHGYENNDVITLEFDDGTVTKAVNEHGYFDVNLNKFVAFNSGNTTDYIGHNFIKEDGDGYTTVKLVNCTAEEEYIEAYSILSAYHYNFITDKMFSLTSSVKGLDYFMPFEIGDGLKYNEEKMKADIENYGLYSYEDLEHLLTMEEYTALNAKYMKVSIGKGIISWGDFVKIIKIEVLEETIEETQPDIIPDEDATTDENEPVALAEVTEEIETAVIELAGNTVTAASYGINLVQNGNILTLTATGNATTGYAIITLDGDPYYTNQIAQGKTITVTVDHLDVAQNQTATAVGIWGNVPETVIAITDTIDLGTLGVTINGAAATLSNTTKYGILGDVYMAVYNGNNLLNVSLSPNFAIDGKKDETYNSGLEIPEGATVKVFVWSPGTMMPILK